MKNKIKLISLITFLISVFWFGCEEDINNPLGDSSDLTISEDPDGSLGLTDVVIPTETAFAYNCDDARNCFNDIDPDFSRWGWVNGPLAEGTYYFDLYAGAGQCYIDKGIKVGLVTVDYTGGTAVVTFETCGDYLMSETHLYVGTQILPGDKKGNPTVSPGQYPDKHGDLDDVNYDEYTVPGLSGDINVIAHAVVYRDDHGAFEDWTDCGQRGCYPLCQEVIYLADGKGKDPNKDQTTLNTIILDDNSQTATVTQILDLGGYDHFDLVNHIGTSPDGNIVYVVDEEEGYLGVYDVVSGIFIEVGQLLKDGTTLVEGIVQVAVSPVGTIYVASKETNKIYTVSGTSLTELGSPGVDIQGADLTFIPDGTLYLYTNFDKKLYEIDPSDGTIIGGGENINAGSITGIATVPGTSTLLLSDTGPGDTGPDKIIKIDPDGSNRIEYTIVNFEHRWGDMASSGCN